MYIHMYVYINEYILYLFIYIYIYTHIHIYMYTYCTRSLIATFPFPIQAVGGVPFTGELPTAAVHTSDTQPPARLVRVYKKTKL